MYIPYTIIHMKTYITKIHKEKFKYSVQWVKEDYLNINVVYLFEI